MKSVLIFGISGFVGKYLSEEFITNGYHVEGSDLQYTENIPSEVCFTACDILNINAVTKLIKEKSPEYIVNLAAVSSVSTSWEIPSATISVNVIGTLNILEAAKTVAPMPKVMLIGSSEEYQQSINAITEDAPLNANNPYGISKMTQELFVDLYRKRYHMEIAYVRPFNHTGVGQKDNFVLPSFCKQSAEIERSGKSGVIHAGNLDVKRDFCDVRDVVRAYRMILENKNSSTIYNIGSGHAYSLSELLTYIISLSSQKIEVLIDSDMCRPVDSPIVVCDNNKIKMELGWEPEYSIFDTLREMYQYYLQD